MASETVSVSGLAGRYATALFELASESKSLDAVASDLGAAERACRRFARSRTSRGSPVFTREEQGRAVDAVLARLGVNTLTRNFVGLLAAKRRLFALPGIVTAFQTLLANLRGEMSAEVTSAQALKPEQRTALLGTLKDAMKRDQRAQREEREAKESWSSIVHEIYFEPPIFFDFARKLYSPPLVVSGTIERL